MPSLEHYVEEGIKRALSTDRISLKDATDIANRISFYTFDSYCESVRLVDDPSQLNLRYLAEDKTLSRPSDFSLMNQRFYAHFYKADTISLINKREKALKELARPFFPDRKIVGNCLIDYGDIATVFYGSFVPVGTYEYALNETWFGKDFSEDSLS